MKKIVSTFFCMFIFISVQAQKANPVIKKGSIIKALANMGDADIPIQFTVLSLETPMAIGWEVESYGQGSFEMTAQGLESATELYLNQPNTGVTKLSDNQTFLVISKRAFKTIIDDKTLTYNNIDFTVKSSNEAIKVNNMDIDVFHLLSVDGKIEVWILNNVNFPLVVKSRGLPTDIFINEIK